MKSARVVRQSPGNRMREAVNARNIMPFIGVYDVFSASLAGRQFDALFLSGFGFAASHYGLPDVGFITWSEMVYYVQRIRTVLPDHHILVDIDDDYCDVEVACHVVSILETSGASGVVLEDQERPRRCGHFDGKRFMALDDYLAKLTRVLETRRDLFVVARTDSSDPADIERHIMAFSEAGADAVLVDGLKSLEAVSQLTRKIRQPFCFHQIAGGKSPACTLTELGQAGIKLVIYSTPCLFAAQPAIEHALESIQRADGSLAGSPIGVRECNNVLQENLARRSSPQLIVRPGRAQRVGPPQ
jgi:2-methylisocitrate lyase-like PEP mutase family enzyme